MLFGFVGGCPFAHNVKYEVVSLLESEPKLATWCSMLRAERHRKL